MSATRPDTGGWLIYHPKRHVSHLNGLTIFHDPFAGNQDPYVWNPQFLHSACHMSQMAPEVGQINFWVTGDRWPDFNQLFCDLVFVVQEKVYWAASNSVDLHNPMVESLAAFTDHYQPVFKEHPYTRLRRFTLKADPQRSFQPQSSDHSLIDIAPALDEAGYSLPALRAGLRVGFASKPMRLTPAVARWVYQVLDAAAFRIKGTDIAHAYRLRVNEESRDA